MGRPAASRPLLRFIRWILLCAVCLTPLADLHADVLYLKNGQVILGTIVGQTREIVRLRNDAGRIVTYQKVQIRRISYNEDEEARIRARIAAQEEEAARRAEEARLEEERRRQEEEERLRREEEERREQEQAAQADPMTLTGALWRSALIPGWGQAYQGRGWAGIGHFAGFLGSVYWMQGANRRFEASDQATTTRILQLSASFAFSSFNSEATNYRLISLIQRDTAYSRRGDAAREVGYSRALFATLYLWNIADVILFHPEPDSSVGFRSQHDAAQLYYTWNF